jgi:hypothetical protein
MLATRDGTHVVLPRFRVRRLHRRLGTRGRAALRGRAAARLVGVLVGRATRLGPPAAAFPRFTTRLGLRTLIVVTRALSPRRVELLYIRRS